VKKQTINPEEFDSRAVETAAPSSPKSQNEREIPRPSHFSFDDDGSTLRISFRWIWRRFRKAVFYFAWTSCVAFLCYWVTLNGRWWWLLVLTYMPLAAGGVFVFYMTLAALLNRTVVKVTSELLTIRHGPVPWWGNRSLPIDQLERLYCPTYDDGATCSNSIKR
jgi:hypothetical protein